MNARAWHRLVARILLVTFSTAVTGCEPSAEEPTSTTTVPAPVATTELPPPTTLPTPPLTPPPTLGSQPPQQLGREALRELVAPVALYPDVVLASLLPATTYPDQVREAARLLGPTGTLQRIPDGRGWDGSVLGLMQFPDVLRWLDDNPAWVDEMGQAVTYQQADVLDAVQDYRRLVRDAGNLQSNQYQKVSQVRSDGDIRIEPARPDIVYVPSYDAAAATQPQPAQPQEGINPWLAFGGGAVVGALGAWALYSIFDDDDTEVHHHYHGRRRINRYDNYYYSRGRRPLRSEWRPRDRPYRAPKQDWTRPARLEHGAPASRPAQPLRPPVAGPGETRRELRQERREQKRQEQRQNRQQQRRDQQRQRRDQRQEGREGQQQRRQAQRQQQEQRRTERREERQQRQELQRQRQQQHRAERRERRQENQGERRKKRQGRTE